MVDNAQIINTYNQLKSVGMDVATPNLNDPLNAAKQLNTAATAYNTVVSNALNNPANNVAGGMIIGPYRPEQRPQPYNPFNYRPAQRPQPYNPFNYDIIGPIKPVHLEPKPVIEDKYRRDPNFRPDPHTRPPNFNGPINKYVDRSPRLQPSVSNIYDFNILLGKQNLGTDMNGDYARYQTAKMLAAQTKKL